MALGGSILAGRAPCLTSSSQIAGVSLDTENGISINVGASLVTDVGVGTLEGVGKGASGRG